MLDEIAQIAQIAPLVNTVLLSLVILSVPIVWLQLRKATPLAIRAEVDLVSRHMGELRRAHKEFERELGSLRHERTQSASAISEVHARITDLAESISNRLEEIQKGLSLLACSEENWHRGEKPAFCPLHQQACPLNGK